MKQFFVYPLLLVCLSLNTYSFAQQTTFTGKIVDEHDVPVAGSHIKIYNHGKVAELVSDANGFFSIPQIAAGDYHTDIDVHGRVIRAKKLLIQPEGRVRIYYNFKLFAQGVVISIMAQNKLIADTIHP